MECRFEQALEGDRAPPRSMLPSRLQSMYSYKESQRWYTVHLCRELNSYHSTRTVGSVQVDRRRLAPGAANARGN